MVAMIKPLTGDGFDAWDAFVQQHVDGTFCHRAGWQTVIEQGAGQEAPYLAAYQDGAITGVLPLSVKNHRFFGKALISTMFCVYGGALAADEQTAQTLYNAAWRLARDKGLPLMEIRSETPSHEGVAGWMPAGTAATFRRELAVDDEAQLLAIPRKQRAVVRKSLKNGLSTDWNGDLNVFYELYARSVHGLGTPVFPKRLFAALESVFGDDVEIQLTLDEHGTPVASLMSFYHGGTVMPYYAGGGMAARPLAAHDHMYYQLMLHARGRGCGVFDFGRSKIDTGPYRFKKNWGFEPTPLGYEMRLAPGAEAPNLSQQSGPFAALSRLWRKLPFPLTKLLGPPLARHLG